MCSTQDTGGRSGRKGARRRRQNPRLGLLGGQWVRGVPSRKGHHLGSLWAPLALTVPGEPLGHGVPARTQGESPHSGTRRLGQGGAWPHREVGRPALGKVKLVDHSPRFAGKETESPRGEVAALQAGQVLRMTLRGDRAAGPSGHESPIPPPHRRTSSSEPQLSSPDDSTP